MEQFKGYILTNNKVPIDSFKDKSADELLTYEQVKKLPEFAGIVADGYIVVDIDSTNESEILFQIVKDLELETQVFKTRRGMHFHFKKSDEINKNSVGAFTAIGIRCDTKIGERNSYVLMKRDGEERECIYDNGIGFLPKWLYRIGYNPKFIGKGKGDGRNQALFNYILTLQSQGYSKSEVRETLKIINKYIFSDPLPDDELDTIARDDSFREELFYGGRNGKTFMFDKFAKYLISEHKIIKINNRLHVYKDGLYVPDTDEIEYRMINHISTLKQSMRNEVLNYIDVLIREDTEPSDATLIAFKNGVYDLKSNELLPHSDDYILTNIIPFNYNPDAYSEIADKTLDKMACNDPKIRAIMEELIGYTFYRRNELGATFILTGDKSNGKSTYLSMLEMLLGEDNTVALDLSELGDRFMTAELFGKMANIGDDIGNEFIANTAVFKKLSTGDRLMVERKGKDPFPLNNYAKLIFSANEVPRMNDNTGAVMRRMVIVPFNATFSPSDPDFDPFIKYKLMKPSVMEYLINIGLEGLMRVLSTNKFTESVKVEEQMRDFNLQNNPIEMFFEGFQPEDVVDTVVGDFYNSYVSFCTLNTLKPMSRMKFTARVHDYYGVQSTQQEVDGKRVFLFQYR